MELNKVTSEILNTFSHTELEEFIAKTINEDLKHEAIYKLAIAYSNRQNIEGLNDCSAKYMAYAKSKGGASYLAMAHRLAGLANRRVGNLQKALDEFTMALKYVSETDVFNVKVTILEALGTVYVQLGMYKEALAKFLETYEINKLGTNKEMLAVAAFNTALTLNFFERYAEMIPYLQEAMQYANELNNLQLQANVFIYLGIAHRGLNDHDKALTSLENALAVSERLNAGPFIASAASNLGMVLSEIGRFEEAKTFLDRAWEISEPMGDPNIMKELYGLYFKMYNAQENYKLALEHYIKERELDQELRNDSTMQKAHRLEAQLEIERKEKEIAIERARHEKELANTRLQTLSKIASEMAHEIQNPLQFVNNFSEVNLELNQEIIEFLDKEDYEEVRAINNDIKQNNKRIKEHGQRISKIVAELQTQANKAEAGELEIDTTNPHDFGARNTQA